MKVKCIDNYKRESELTIGRDYVVIAQLNAVLKVINNDGIIKTYHKSKFIN